MTGFLVYTLEAGGCIIICYLFYYVLLRRFTFFAFNRMFLVFAMAFSALAPVARFSMPEVVPPITFIQGSPAAETNNILVGEEYWTTFKNNQNVKDYLIEEIIPAVYMVGFMVVFFRFLFSIYRVFRTKRKAMVCRTNGRKVYKTDGGVPFSFLNMVFLPASETNRMVLEHELTHVRQFHWVDLVLTELLSIALWYNPFVAFYKRSLKLQHEYLADKKAGGMERPEEYMRLVLARAEVVGAGGLECHFYFQTIKKRMIMITKDKTSAKYKTVYLLFLPVILLALFAFSENKVGIPDLGPPAKPAVIQERTTFTQEAAPNRYPVAQENITGTSAFGMRTHPKTNKETMHQGMDFRAAEGVEVASTADGTVSETGYDSSYGNFVVVKHNSDFSTKYSHLKDIVVKKGDKISGGSPVGHVGNTGLATSPHLHYEVLKGGERVDPGGYLPE